MEKILNEIRLNYTDTEINSILKNSNEDYGKSEKHFNQNEEFFLKLDKDFIVPSLPVHHDIKSAKPSKEYLNGIKDILEQLCAFIPQIFTNLIYFFDPGEILRPCFFQLFRLGDKQFLYLMRIDLTFRIHESEMLNQGSNDFTPEFSSRNLFLEADFIPLQEVKSINNKIAAFIVNQTVSQTWIGETGRGYFVQGIWIDQELTKFFSKLLIPNGIRSYPYYPFSCKYRTICHTVVNLDLDGRKKHLPLLVRAMNFLVPRMREIEKTLKNAEFSIELPYFVEQKKETPPQWKETWKDLSIKPYLNVKDMKEFKIDF